MKNIKFSRLFAAVAFVAILALAGCKQPEEETHYAIEGTWVSASDSWIEKYVITGSEVKNYGNGNLGYAGDSVEINELSDKSGYIYMKYTRAINPDWSYSEDAPDVGKWYAIYYFDLTDKSVKLSASSNFENGGVSACESLEEAKKTLTVENGYMSEAAGHYSECAKE